MSPRKVSANPASAPQKVGLWRYALATGAVLAFGVMVVARMVMLQIGPERDFARHLVGDAYPDTIAVPRGLIYDREGHLLAGDQAAYEMDLHLDRLPADILPDVAAGMATVLNMDTDTLTRLLVQNKAKGVPLVRVAPYVSREQKRLLEGLPSQWRYRLPDGSMQTVAADVMDFHFRFKRFYPEGGLAANVLGFVAPAEGKGYGGVEGYYDALLCGGVRQVFRSYTPWEMDTREDDLVPPAPVALYLTLDRALQQAAEEEAWRAIQQTQAKSATIIVADPHTGEILAMAEQPRPNLNNYDAVIDHINTWNALNFAVETAYEPGSVFKIVTMAAAVDAGVVQPQTVFHDTGTFQVRGRSIWNWNRGAWGDQTMVGCLQHSLNTCLAWVAVDRLQQDAFYAYLRRFGFGRRTGIDLAGEAPGFYRVPSDTEHWSESDWASQSFGQAISVTPVQMVAAASVIANGGYWVTPHVLRSEVVEGRVSAYRSEATLQVISEEAARTMGRMLAESLQGEASSALVPGYEVAGKTGTAEIAEGEAGYVSAATNASFVGWFPVERPQYVIYVWLERPQTSRWASVVAAPVFARMVRRVATIENVPPDSVRKKLGAASVGQP